ncbi:hypothetical protein AGMMS49940_05990 [Spirochaetia bacterium]|nr:hypothetical protein AGMMS49940_05990 [Spirochaetia bacterium]
MHTPAGQRGNRQTLGGFSLVGRHHYDSAIHCDELISLPKTLLTDYVGKLSADKIRALKGSLLAALELQEIDD